MSLIHILDTANTVPIPYMYENNLVFCKKKNKNSQ